MKVKKKMVMFRDKMEKHEFTAEQISRADMQMHKGLKKMHGFEHLDFYEDRRGRYCCKYISDPDDFNYESALDNVDLMFLLNALSMQQGKVFFDDYKQCCVGLDQLNEFYLPMKLAGL